MTDRAKNPRRILTTFVASVLIASLLSMTVVSNGFALQNVGVFLGLLPASSASSAYGGTTLLQGLTNIVQLAYAAPSSSAAANIDQCTNGGVGKTPEPCKIGGVYSNWVNGNSNGQKSHWKEGEFISYRATITGLSGNGAVTHTLRIQYDTVQGSKHAIDYLGSFDATETTGAASGGHANQNNPCGDKFTCVPSTPVDSETIDNATLTNCAGSVGASPAQFAGQIKGFVASGKTLDITDFSYVSQNVQSGGGQCSTTADITFQTTANVVVLAWGGHIASEAPASTPAPISGWGAGNSASYINGSPFHMRLQLLDGASTGNQDRALSTSAVVFTPTITTTIRRNSDDADVTNGFVADGTTVHDTATLIGASSLAGGTVVYKFYSIDNCTGTVTSSETVSVTNGLVQNSTSHTLTSPFGTTSGYCFTATYSGDSKNIGPVTSPIEPVTVNPPPAGTITIIKDTNPDDNSIFSFEVTTGTLTPSSFTLKDNGTSIGNSRAFSNVQPGTYNITELANSAYGTSVSCTDSTSNSSPGTSAVKTRSAIIQVDSGDTIVCTFTNTKLLVKVTAFGYTNEPAGLPVGGFVNGTSVYTVKVKNFGGATALVDVTLTPEIVGDVLGAGTFKYVSAGGSPAPTTAPSGGTTCVAGCNIVWNDISIASGTEITLTVTVAYNGVPDGTVVQMHLTSNYDTDIAGTTVTHATSGSEANITFTAQSD